MAVCSICQATRALNGNLAPGANCRSAWGCAMMLVVLVGFGQVFGALGYGPHEWFALPHGIVPVAQKAAVYFERGDRRPPEQVTPARKALFLLPRR